MHRYVDVLYARLNFGWVIILFVAFVFFFFQAEDGIRDTSVTGVQTCALPIFPMVNYLEMGGSNVYSV